MRSIKGLAISVFALTVTVLFWVASKNGAWSGSPWRLISQISSLSGLVVLSFTFVLSARWFVVEKWFGGLDAVYKYHRMFGGVAFLLLVEHPIFLVLSVLPNQKAANTFLLFGSDLAYNLGLAGLYLMMGLLVLTLAIKMPYHIWKITHEWMGMVWLLGGAHSMLIYSDVSRFFPLKLWMMLWLLLAGVAVVYKRFVYGRLGPRFEYTVDRVTRVGDVVEILLDPKDKKMEFWPGQFAFISFPGEVAGSEEHPFTMAGEMNGKIRFAIKILGDWSLRVKDIEKGARALVWGPYGKFGEKFYKDGDVVCVAGGIGITPFLSLLRGEKHHKRKGRVTLFYCTKHPEEAIYLHELKEISRDNPEIKIVGWCSDRDGRISIKEIEKAMPDITKAQVYLCGPKQMTENLIKQMNEMGVSNLKIHYEDFNFL